MSYYDEGLDTTKFFEAISGAYKFGIKLKGFPKIVLVGMQSGGKSSLCEALAGNNKGILPKLMGMGTMKPTYITTIQSEYELYKVGDKDFSNEFSAKEEINRLNMNNHVKEINIVVYEPYIQNSQFVDLPGLFCTNKSNPDLPKKISEITKKHLEDQNNIILIVHSAGSDIATNKALSYVEKAQMENNSIGVITKTDLIDSSSVGMIQDLLKGRSYNLGYGYCAVVLRNKTEIDNNMTIRDKINKELTFFEENNYLAPGGILVLRKMISNIQFNKIKAKLPYFLNEIEKEIVQLSQSMNFIDKLIDDPNKTLVIKLRFLIEKLIGNSLERAEFEKELSNEFHKEINNYMRKSFKCNDSYTPSFSEQPININVHNIIKNNTLPEDKYENDDFKQLFNYGQLSPVIINNNTVSGALIKEISMGMNTSCFDFVILDPLNKKRNEWIKNVQKYFSGLLNDNKIQDIVYNVTTKNIIKFINDDTNSNELTQKFTEYIIKEISHEVYEDKIKYSITSMINIEKRPNISVYEIGRYLIKMYEDHFTFKNGFTRKYNLTNNSNKILIEIYGESWTEAYFKAVSDKIAENCYRNVAVNLIDRLADKLLEMIIDLFNKNNSEREKNKIHDKMIKLKELYNVIIEYKDKTTATQ